MIQTFEIQEGVQGDPAPELNRRYALSSSVFVILRMLHDCGYA